MKIEEFAEKLGSKAPAPGGGAAAAMAGAFGVSLMQMVAELTLANAKHKDKHTVMEEIISVVTPLQKKFYELMDSDAQAFSAYVEAMQLPKSGPEEKEKRKNAMREACYQASLVPVQIMECARSAMQLLPDLAEYGTKHAVSDVGVAGLYLQTAFCGSELNVLINLSGIKDEQKISDISAGMEKIRAEFEKAQETAKSLVIDRL